ncbi:MAG: hypothetical protein GY798_15575 [Hyphomicrobiales bacterium]|nr:hypothetical protein [Hyphomicrobiales bacterium]
MYRITLIHREGATGRRRYSTKRGGFLREIHSALFETVGVAPRIVQEVSRTRTVLSLVNGGIGIALVPRSAMALKMEQP